MISLLMTYLKKIILLSSMQKNHLQVIIDSYEAKYGNVEPIFANSDLEESIIQEEEDYYEILKKV